jgi:hypothetical protein
MAIDKLKIHKSPGIDQIPAQLNKAGGGDNSLSDPQTSSVWNKQELPDE